MESNTKFKTNLQHGSATVRVRWRTSNWNTPNFVLRGSSATKRAYISGFFDAEGSINSLDKYGANYFKPKDIRIYFAQANKRVLEELKSMIESFGIKCGNVVGPYVKKGTSTKMYGLIIHGREQCSNFYKTFYVYHPDKKKKVHTFAIWGDKDSSVVSPRSVDCLRAGFPEYERNRESAPLVYRL